MECDQCKKDVPFWELHWDGRWKHSDTLTRIHRRKREICETCLGWKPMRLEKIKRTISPKEGWKSETYYIVEVAFGPGNPVHTKIFYSGFVDKINGMPGGYNQLFVDRDTGYTTIRDVWYLRPIGIIEKDIDHP